MPGTPVLAGQHSFYAITQLFLFREGRRSNEAMTAVAKTHEGRRPARLLRLHRHAAAGARRRRRPTPPDAARMSKGQALAQQHKCLFCHGADLAGGQQVPRIGGQREDYLQRALHGFKSGDAARLHAWR